MSRICLRYLEGIPRNGRWNIVRSFLFHLETSGARLELQSVHYFPYTLLISYPAPSPSPGIRYAYQTVSSILLQDASRSRRSSSCDANGRKSWKAIFATSNFFYNLITVESLTIVIMRPFTPGWYFARAQESQNIRDAFHDRYLQERQFKLEIQVVRLSLVSRTLSYDNKNIFPSFWCASISPSFLEGPTWSF
jgi:hypothetical protein